MQNLKVSLWCQIFFIDLICEGISDYKTWNAGIISVLFHGKIRWGVSLNQYLVLGLFEMSTLQIYASLWFFCKIGRMDENYSFPINIKGLFISSHKSQRKNGTFLAKLKINLITFWQLGRRKIISWSFVLLFFHYCI